MMKLRLIFSLLLLGILNLQASELYTVFGPNEHMANPETYQKVQVENKSYSKAMVFMDVNFSLEEIQKANQAAKELGKVLLVMPKMDWSLRQKLADAHRNNDKLNKKISDLYNKQNDELDEIKKAEYNKLIEEYTNEIDKNKKFVDSIVKDPKYTLQNKNIPALIKELEKDNYSLDTLIVSGHSGGTSSEGKIEYYGDASGEDTDINRENIIKVFEENSNSPSLQNLGHVYISACNAMTPYEAKIWMKGLPSLQSCTGYLGQAGRSTYPAVNGALKEDLLGAEIFYQNLMNKDKELRDDEISKQITNLYKEFPSANLNLSMVVRNPDGSLDYAGQAPNKKIQGDLDELAFEEEADICQEQSNKIMEEYTPEFLAVKSQLTLYKTAWTTLVLAGMHKNDEIKSLETVMNSSIKSFFDKVETDPSYKKQYEQLLAYESPYKTKWMTDKENYMPAAIEFLASKMHSQEFLDSVLKDTYKGQVGEKILPTIQTDINKYGVDFSDAKTMELMHDLYKNDKFGNKFLSNYSTQITASMKGRGGLKSVDDVFYRKEIDKLSGQFSELNKKIADKIKEVCGGDDQSLVSLLTDGRCELKDPTQFENILEFKPILDKIKLDNFDIKTSSSGYDVTHKWDPAIKSKIDKKYLKVSPMSGQCNFTFQDNQLPVISFSNIPKTGEYSIAYIGESGKSKEVLLAELNAGMKSKSSYQAKLNYYNEFLKKNNIFTKQIRSEEIKFKGNSTGTFFKHDFDQSEIDPTKAHFDGIDGGYDIKISKDKVQNFMVLSSWGNNNKQINCKEGKVLNEMNNPVRMERIARAEEERKKQEQLERERIISQNPQINNIPNSNTFIPFDYRNGHQEYLNGLTNGSTITQYHKEHPELGDYMVMDKNASRIMLYNSDGFLKRIIDVKISAEKGDEKPGTINPVTKKENNTVGAGIYSTTRSGKSSTGSANDILFIKDERGESVKTSIRSMETNPNCTNCIQVPQEYMKLVLNQVHAGNKLYVLPEDDKNYFKIKNDDLNFTTQYNSRGNATTFTATNYNFSPKNTDYFENKSILKGSFTYQDQLTPALTPSPLLLVSPAADLTVRGVAAYNGITRTVDLSTHPIALDFVGTLDKEKKNLMKMYNLDNDEYNQLSKIAFGLLGNESEFGLGNKYIVKEYNQNLVTTVKNVQGNFSDNSRGLTQIKEIPKSIVDNYGINPDDLRNAPEAAIATIGVLAEKLQVLKRIEYKHPEITPENRMEYLPYLYYGNSRQITQGLATPDKNNYVQNIKKYSENYLEIYQKKEPNN